MTGPRRLWLPGPAGRIEALLRVTAGARGAAVLAHPHPQHGGTLDNPVVFQSERALAGCGVTTLRFNFRGAGTSEGRWDDGEGERADVGAAVRWLRGVAPGVPLLVVGYSFGAWCGLRHAVADADVAAFVGIGLPVAAYDFGVARTFGRPLGVVQAERDEYGDEARVREALSGADPAAVVEVVAGTTHLFPGRAADAGRVVGAVAAALVPGLA